MEHADIVQKLQEFFARHVPGREIGIDEELLAAGVLDSMGTVQLLRYVQDNFAVTVSRKEILPQNFGSITAMARFVASKRTE